MRVMLLNQFFWPDTVATAHLLSDVAAGLARENEVTVICGESGEREKAKTLGFGPNVNVLRTKGFRFSHRSFARIASYSAYIAGTIWHGFRHSRAEIYMTLTTPPVLFVIGGALAFIRGGDHVIWEMDVYPDIACDIGYFKRGGFADRLAGAVLDFFRRRASAIIVLGEDMRDRLIARGIPADKIQIAENWADGSEIQPEPFGAGPLVIEYAGNLGLAHELETVTGVIERLRNHPDFCFTFVGGGPRRGELEAKCKELGTQNVEFRPYCNRREIGGALAKCHLGLVTQLPQTVGSVVPSKIYSIMAAGRPILYIGPKGSTPAGHIRRYNCGWQIDPGDVGGLESLLTHLSNNRQVIAETGARARNAFDEDFDKSIGVERILRVIEGLNHAAEMVPKLSPSAIGD